VLRRPVELAEAKRTWPSMAERGVSQLVSVDLDVAVQFREAG
jgi:hypothetical protein